VLYVSCNDFGAASLPVSSLGVDSLAPPPPDESSNLLKNEMSKFKIVPDQYAESTANFSS
jgi:hypothetical protein